MESVAAHTAYWLIKLLKFSGFKESRVCAPRGSHLLKNIYIDINSSIADITSKSNNTHVINMLNFLVFATMFLAASM